MVKKSHLEVFQDPNSPSRNALPIHLSIEQNTSFVNSYSNIRVVRSIARLDGERLSYELVGSRRNKLVI